jgi:hypothetical protein
MKKNAEGTPNGNTDTQLPLLSNAESNGEDVVAEAPRIPPETSLAIAERRILVLESAFEGLRASTSSEILEWRTAFDRREQAHLVKDAILGEQTLLLQARMDTITEVKHENTKLKQENTKQKQVIVLSKRNLSSLASTHLLEKQALTAAHTAKIATVKVLKKNVAQSVNGTNATLKQTVRDLGKKLTLSDDELTGLATQYAGLQEAYDKLGVTHEESVATTRTHKEESKRLQAEIRGLRIQVAKKHDTTAINQARKADAALRIAEINLEKAKVNSEKKLLAIDNEYAHRHQLVDRKANASVQVHGKKQSVNKKVHNEKMMMATERLTDASKLHHANNGMFPGLATGPQSISTPAIGTTDIKAVS